MPRAGAVEQPTEGVPVGAKAPTVMAGGGAHKSRSPSWGTKAPAVMAGLRRP